MKLTKRSPELAEDVLQALREARAKMPFMRTGQILMCVEGMFNDTNMFYVEDEELAMMIRGFTALQGTEQ